MGDEAPRELMEMGRVAEEGGDLPEAGRCFALALARSKGKDPSLELDAALRLFADGGDARAAAEELDRLKDLEGFEGELIAAPEERLLEPNLDDLKDTYRKNVGALKRYPWCFRDDFPPFEGLATLFIPLGDARFVPLDKEEGRLGDVVDLGYPEIAHHFFGDLERPICAHDVYSRYELSYLRDSVRRSEDVAYENHVYLHYTDWGEFASHLMCFSWEPLLEDEQFVFLIEDEIGDYPIDFKERFGIDYASCKRRPVAIRDIKRLIWQAQTTTHNGGDFFNEVMDGHPNVLTQPSILLERLKEEIASARSALDEAESAHDAAKALPKWSAPVVHELFGLEGRTDKDVLVGYYISDMIRRTPKGQRLYVDTSSRITPALYLQPHLSGVSYQLLEDKHGHLMLFSEGVDAVARWEAIEGFDYIKAFMPLRRITSSYAASLKFACERYERYGNTEGGADGQGAGGGPQKEDKKEERTLIYDVLINYALGHGWLVDPRSRPLTDSRLVRFEDGKLSPKATFTRLAEFLDIPYTRSMGTCTLLGHPDPESYPGNARGFDASSVYRDYGEYANASECTFLEYFTRDAYERYGYDFRYWDGEPLDEGRLKKLIAGFSVIDGHMERTWMTQAASEMGIYIDGERVPIGAGNKKAWEDLFGEFLRRVDALRLRYAEVLEAHGLAFENAYGERMEFMRMLEPDPALLDAPLYR